MDRKQHNIRNITKEILIKINKLKTRANKDFINYYCDLLCLDPKWNITEDPTNRENIETLINHILQKLQDQNTPEIITLKMQVFFKCNFENRLKIVYLNRQDLFKQLLPLRNDILKSCDEELFKKITYYITLSSGLGNPMKSEVFEEASIALKSVFNSEELKIFADLPKEEKQEKLDFLSKLVVGVRLFNWDCGKGGQGIENLPTLLDGAGLSIKAFAQETLSDLELVEGHFDLQVAYRQAEQYIKTIITEINDLLQEINDNSRDIKQVLTEIHRIVYMRIAVPAKTIFPKFIELAGNWSQLQTKTLILVKLHEIITKLMEYLGFIVRAKHNEDMPSRDKFEPIKLLESNHADITVLAANSNENLHFQYAGFCPLSLLKGFVICGLPELGVFRFNNLNYVFATCEFAQTFMNDPGKVINEVLEVARLKPFLINFLGVKNDLFEVRHLINLVEKTVKIQSLDAGIQTELHVYPTRIQKDYTWNVWELKRQALHLANLTKKRTISSQTVKSFSKVSCQTQTCDQKSQETQTKSDKNV